MKIAIAANAKGWKEKVDSRFGRAKGFFIVDTENNQTEYIDNSANVEVGHGAGTSASQTVVESGVKVLLTNEVGPNAGTVLKAAGIKVLTGIDNVTVEEAYDRYKKNELTEQSL